MNWKPEPYSLPAELFDLHEVRLSKDCGMLDRTADGSLNQMKKIGAVLVDDFKETGTKIEGNKMMVKDIQQKRQEYMESIKPLKWEEKDYINNQKDDAAYSRYRFLCNQKKKIFREVSKIKNKDQCIFK